MVKLLYLTPCFCRPKRYVATTPTIDAAKVDGEENVNEDESGKQAKSKTTGVETVV